MTTTQTPPMEDDVKPIRDALALGPTLGQWSVDGHFGEWGIASDHSVDGAACKSGRQFVAACFRVSKKDTPKYAAMFEATARYIAAANPERLTRLLAHIDAQAVRLEAAERDAARYRFIRSGGAYIEPSEAETYMADDLGGKYYGDMRDFDMDIDSAIDRAAIASEAGK